MNLPRPSNQHFYRTNRYKIATLSLLMILCWNAFPLLASENAERPFAEISLPRTHLPLASGGVADLQTMKGEKATLLVFMSTHCPISNGYIPELKQIAEEYKADGLKVIGLNPNAGQSLREMAAHAEEYSWEFPLLRDAGAQVAAAVGVSICPEVVLFDGQGKLAYRGRIDDRYVFRGGAPRNTRQADLRVAIDSLLHRESIATPKTEALGCPILFPKQAKTSKEGNSLLPPEVTYSQQVSRILRNRCESCHREGGIGPFSLTNLEEATLWADDIKHFTADGTMPPWKPVDGFGEFENKRSMPQEEIELLARWVALGCPEGDPSQLPPPAEFQEGWTLGQPDAIFSPQESYTVSSEGLDDYRCFVIPTNFDTDQYVVAMEVLPGNASVVHHVIAFLDQSGAARRMDARTPGPGYSTPAGFPGFLPSGGLGGWAPGNVPDPLPASMAKILPAGADLVIQVHYHKTGKVEVDRTQIGLYFSEVPVDRAVYSMPLAPFGGPFGGMTIPARESHYKVEASRTLYRDALAVEVTPHMHLLGKEMKVTATFPNGKTAPIIYIKDWDFNWQETYQFKEPFYLPKGTTLNLTAYFDNSEGNPYNPHHPPQEVRWGPQTTDEMCIAFFSFVPQEKASSQAKLQQVKPRELMLDAFRDQWQRKFNSSKNSNSPPNPIQRFLQLRNNSEVAPSLKQ
ncbi:Thiol-disulfide oxidoreductase ResA [Planctomycetales bacterium 10988]|nr:Thiol-disulfide oxidoreductase ResA [Planctomycetales bacterium 10988]